MWTLNKQDIKKILRDFIMLYSPVFLIFLDQIQNWTFDTKILYALTITTTIWVVRRFLQDNK